MCGIVAWAGKNPKKFNLGKFTTIGILNEERGIDSCGVAVDGVIERGIDKTARFRNFAAEGIALPTVVPTVIGHTRKTSVGVINMNNAHPFGFGKTDEFENKFIGVHNGTIYNQDEFCKNHGVEEFQTMTTKVKRRKIDSEIVLECIYRSNSYKVLEEYFGLAALVFMDMNEPNALYVYRGASVKKIGGKDDTIYFERPLYYYQETRNSVYISSIESSLYTIGGTSETVMPFLGNGVYKIVDGNVAKADITIINRDEAHQDKWGVKPKVETKRLPVQGFRRLPSNETGSRSSTVRQHAKIRAKAKGRNGIKYAFEIDNNIHRETSQREHYGRFLFFKNFRFYRTGHLANGVYTYIKGIGFHFLAMRIKDAEATFWGLVGQEYKDGYFKAVNNRANCFIPFSGTKKSIDELGNKMPLYYFYDGIMLKERLDYSVVLEQDYKGQPFDLDNLSHMSAHPVINIHSQNVHASEQHIIKNGKIYTGDFTILGADRSYKVINGNLKKFYNISTIQLNEKFSYALNNDHLKLDETEKKKVYNLFSEVGVELDESKMSAVKPPFQGGQFVIPPSIGVSNGTDYLSELEDDEDVMSLLDSQIKAEEDADKKLDRKAADVIVAGMIEKHFCAFYDKLPWIIDEFTKHEKQSKLAVEVNEALSQFNQKLTEFVTV